MLWLYIGLLVAWVVLLYAGRKWFKNHGMDTYGPMLLMRTKRFQGFIERISVWRWDIYADVGIVLGFVIMVFVTILMAWQAVVVMSIPTEYLPQPRMAIGLPGVNPMIPIGYGIVGLSVAVIFHEFSHAVLTRHEKLPLLSLGVVLLLVPIGAFAEPDEKKLRKASPKTRMRIYTAGPTSNMVLAVVFFLLFSIMLSSVSAPVSGAMVSSAYPSSQIQPGSLLTGLGNVSINSASSIENISLMPGNTVSADVRTAHGTESVMVVAGIRVNGIIHGFPAEASGISVGEYILAINNTTVKNFNDYDNITALLHPGDTVVVSLYNTTLGVVNRTVTLSSRWDYYSNYSSSIPASWKDQPFFGFQIAYMGMGFVEPEYYLSEIAPHISSDPGQWFGEWLHFISLPFYGLMPVSSSVTWVFSTPFSGAVFWTLLNTFYWIFWLNLMVGLFNFLPAVPLDGGYLFADGLRLLWRRLFKTDIKERMLNTITLTSSIFVLFLILWQFVGPRIF